MSTSCETKSASCCGADVAFDGASPAYRRVLGVVIALNVLGFAVVAAGGVRAGSTALSANALDFAADAATYAISLWAIGKSAGVRATAALAKGASLAVLAAMILGYAVARALAGAPPFGEIISGVGLVGVALNLVAALLLLRYRDGDANVRSVWICTRNDILHGFGVAIAGALVWVTGSRWPDLVAGVVLAAIFLQSAWSIVAQARWELRRPAPRAVTFEVSRRDRPAH